MHHEISDRHHTARDQGREARQQTQGDEEPANQFDVAADHAEGVERHGLRNRWKAQDLLPAVTRKEQAYDQAHDAINRIRETTERFHLRRLFGGGGDVKILTQGAALCNRRFLRRRFQIAPP